MIRLHRRMGRLAVAATAGLAVIAVTGVAVAGAASGGGADATRRTITSLVYTCRFPSGARQAIVRVTAGFPVAGTVGRAIQPTGVRATVTVPHAAVGDLGRLGATTVRASAALAVTVAEGRASTIAAWRALTAGPARLPAADSLALHVAGAVPPAKPSAPGRVTFTADGMLLVLSPRKASGAATRPPTLAVPCRQNLGQGARLATVTVLGPSSLPTGLRVPGDGRRTPRGPGSHVSTKCFIRSKLPGIGSAFVAGYSNVRKLHGAALVGPGPDNNPRAGLSHIRNVEVVTDVCAKPAPIVYQYAIGELSYHGKSQFPPAVATFLNFGFVPVTTTLTVSVVPSDCRDISGKVIAKTGLCIVVKQPVTTTQYVTTITSEENIHVSGLAVNGVPLNVGQNCQTVTPTTVTLTGESPQYALLTGGPVQGDITVPQFNNSCGVGEDLAPLLNASVSGPNNFAILTQGPLCEKFPKHPANANCKISPGKPGYPYGLPKFYPKPVH